MGCLCSAYSVRTSTSQISPLTDHCLTLNKIVHNLAIKNNWTHLDFWTYNISITQTDHWDLHNIAQLGSSHIAFMEILPALSAWEGFTKIKTPHTSKHWFQCQSLLGCAILGGWQERWTAIQSNSDILTMLSIGGGPSTTRTWSQHELGFCSWVLQTIIEAYVQLSTEQQ